MRPWLKNLLQFLIGIGLAAGLLYLTYRDTDLNQLWETLSSADPFWLAMNAALLMAVFIFRALRWNILLVSAGHPASKFNTTLSVLIAYLVNTATPRLGEIVRCSVIYQSDRVPVATSLGTVFSERVIDMIVLLLGVGLIGIFELEEMSLFVKNLASLSGDGGQTEAGILPYVLLAIGVGGLVALFLILRSKQESGIIARLRHFLNQMFSAAKSVFQMKNPGLFLLYTALIWISLTLMMFTALKALPESSHLGIGYAILLLFIGGIGWALPAPGGIGTTHYIVENLFVAYGQTAFLGGAVGFLSNTATNVFTVFFGLIGLLVYFALIGRKRGERGQVEGANQ